MANSSKKTGHGFKKTEGWRLRILEIHNKLIWSWFGWFWLVFSLLMMVYGIVISFSGEEGAFFNLVCIIPLSIYFMIMFSRDQLGFLKRRWSAKRAVDKLLPTHLKEILKTEVKIYHRLPERLRSELERKMVQFLASIPFKLKGSFEAGVMDRARVCVAAEACLLVVHRDFAGYRWLKEVEICQHLEGEGVAGRASRDRVWLKWDEVKLGMADCTDGHSVTIHEFAHILDRADDNRAQSNPFPKGSPEFCRWEEMLDREFDRLWEAHESGEESVLGRYALTIKHEYKSNKSGGPMIRPEFFSCATEAFFERPKELQGEFPKLFDLMREFYRLDPAEWS